MDYYRFPGGNASQTHGWDGISELREAVALVPAGRTIWKFKTGANYKTDADRHYSQMVQKLSLEERKKSNYILVTARIWDTGREIWEQERSDDGWLNIKAYDANTLENWLADQPAVAIHFAKKLQILPPAGFRTISDFWDEHSLNTRPPLAEDLLLGGREERAKRLCDSLSAGLPGLSKWQADSATEAALFVSAVMRKADAELSDHLLSKALFIESTENARQLPSTGGFILVLFPENHRLGPALARMNQVILVLGSNDIAASPVEQLDQMTTQDFAAALRAMGIKDNEAFRHAGICCRSVTVFSRLNAHGTVAPPTWSTDAALVPLALAGSWDASNEHDRALISALCDRPYDQVDLDARRLASIPDAPLDLDGSIWTMRSPKDAFILLGALVGNVHQGRLRDACVVVFSEIDQTLNVPDEDQSLILTRGADFQHSEWLRRGLSRTLLLISGLHQAARFRTIGLTPEQFIDDVVRRLPNLAVDILVLASLKSEFPMLMEAAPFPLASALEQVLEGPSEKWAPLIFRGKKDSPFFGQTSPHTYILWAVETLAWNPAYLYRAASILLRLAEADPGGATTNRPLDSLRRIFLAWRPQTYALLAERIAIVRRICMARSEIGFKLALALLPVSHDSTHDTAKPRLRDFGDAANASTTRMEMAAAFRAFGSLATELADGHAGRLMALIDRFAGLEPESRECAINAIRSVAATANGQERFEIWTKLRLFTQHHRGFRKTDWALRDEQLHLLEALCEEIAPDDPVHRDLWQFNRLVPKMEMRAGGDYIEESNRSRTEVVRSILNDRGIPAVIALAKAAKEPYLVGFALAEAAQSEATLQEVFRSQFTTQSEINEDFFVAVSGAAHFRFGPTWDHWIADVAANSDARRGAILFFRWPDSRDTWSFVQSLDPSIEQEYWKSKYTLNQSSDENLLFAIAKYNSVGRFSASVDLIAYQEKRVPTEVCIRALRGLVGELNASGWNTQNEFYSVTHLLAALQERKDVSIEELATLEYQYLPVLEHQGEPVALVQLLKSSPKFFIEVICDVFSPASEKEGGEISEAHRAKARLGYQMLQSMKSLPGFTNNGHDEEALIDWVAEARVLAREADRESIADQQIGQMLAHAPVDAEDGAWPVRAVRDVIEQNASDEIERGMAIARFNMRGLFHKALYEGGQEERAFAAQYQEWAQVAAQWPRTCRLLRKIADDWKRDAEQADIRAELDQRLDP